MRLVVIFSGLLFMATGIGSAQQPQISYGPPGGAAHFAGRGGCQYGFQDDLGGGITLGFGQQLGIQCTGPITIASVGFYVEFVTDPGSLDIVVYDDGIEVSRTTVTPLQGTNDFDITDVNISGTACVMLCPTSFLGVTGEDYTNAPFAHTFWSHDCTCEHEFTNLNLAIWVDCEGCSQIGACCLVDGTCTIATETGCQGTFMGDGVPCRPNPCPQPPQACCFTDGHCEVLPPSECLQQGGAYQADGVPCDPNPCDALVACCLGDGSCEMLSAEMCGSSGGVAEEPGSTCTPNPCLPSDVSGTVSGAFPVFAAPNPTGATSRITYWVAAGGPVTIQVSDIQGRVVREMRAYDEMGTHSQVWDGKDGRGNLAPAGIYVVRVTTATRKATTRVVLAR